MALENLVIDTATGKIKVGAGGGGGGATDPVLAKWNETDLTQFTTQIDSFTGGLSLSVVTNTLLGRNTIKASVGSGSLNSEHAFVLFNTSSLLQSLTQLPLRYIVRMRVMYADNNMMVGPAYAMNELSGSSFRALGVCMPGNSATIRCAVYDGGAISENSNTVGMQQPGTSSSIRRGGLYIGEFLYAVGTPGTPYLYLEGKISSWPLGAVTYPVSSGYGWISPLGSNWNSYTPTTAGMFFRGDTATFGGVGDTEILSFEILRHPMDL